MILLAHGLDALRLLLGSEARGGLGALRTDLLGLGIDVDCGGGLAIGVGVRAGIGAGIGAAGVA
ncbi:hypothetical protein N5079_35195, partial [Planotetraspora sp. A-T 1434]|uniref:hypothetical protein n=1 Tax=Planotetraspora sp. A-T 1434 TaxID=2979219 RepID=UPI0021BEC914